MPTACSLPRRRPQFERFAKNFAPHMLEDERFSTPRPRVMAHNQAFRAAVDAALGGVTVADAMAIFVREDIPAAPVTTLLDSWKHPQVAHNQTTVLRPNPHLEGATVRDVRLAPTLKGSPLRVADHAPLYGQHTREVLLAAGFSEAQVQGYADEKVVNLGFPEKEVATKK
jgi:crotonobetainyl-CoA:carnitine CoA-transferase CaiB-like acyl-CoA transferase